MVLKCILRLCNLCGSARQHLEDTEKAAKQAATAFTCFWLWCRHRHRLGFVFRHWLLKQLCLALRLSFGWHRGGRRAAAVTRIELLLLGVSGSGLGPQEFPNRAQSNKVILTPSHGRNNVDALWKMSRCADKYMGDGLGPGERVRGFGWVKGRFLFHRCRFRDDDG